MSLRVWILCGCLISLEGVFLAQEKPDKPTGTGGNDTSVQRHSTDAGPGVTPPQLISSVNPDYPEWARNGKHPIQGTYVVGLIVGEDGQPRDVHIIRSPDKRLDQKATDAVKQWKFKPAMKGNKPVAVQLAVEVQFVLYPKEGSSGK
jgi:protein TonB